MQNQKIIDKICKCLRLAESGNPNEAASALRQAHRLMHKYNITEDQINAAGVAEAMVGTGSRYNPPFWAVALSNIVAEAFECRVLVARRYGKQPEFRFIGLDHAPRIASYSFTVLYRQLERVRREFIQDLGLEAAAEQERRGDVFAQAWLFRVARSVAEFAGRTQAREAVDNYIQTHYGITRDLEQQPVNPAQTDYEDILSGMRAADDVALFRSMDRHFRPYLPLIEQTA